MVMTPLLASVPFLFLRHTELPSALVALLMLVSVWLLIVGIHAATPHEQLQLPVIARSAALAGLIWFVLFLLIERCAFWVIVQLISAAEYR